MQREKQLASAKFISKLTKSDGTSTASNKEIVEECTLFYKKLYTKESIDSTLDSYFLHEMPALSDDAVEQCEGEITLKECEIALKNMANYKTPGLDGLPKEFYVFAFPYIGNTFVDLLNRCWKEKILPKSQREGLITLICKDSTQSDDLSKWRPISLLNIDYKILSKVLSMRLRAVIGEIVHPDQTCSIPGRSILDNVHLIRNLIEYTDDKNSGAAIISLDQSKAFDRVSHDYLFKVLHTFGFGEQFISLVKLLYTDIFSKVLANGYISEQFPVERSVRQGCSLSPLLYVLCMEPFAQKIRTSPMIRGLHLPGSMNELRICQYADDTNLFVSDITSVRHILILVELYELVSGAKLNKQKTFGMWLGKWKNRIDKPAELNWTSKCTKFYGVYLGSEEANLKNWDIILSKFRNCVNLYSRRVLSFRGRSVILKSVLCTPMWYVGNVLLMPEGVRLKLNRLLFNFVWNGKPEVLKRLTLLHGYSKGGLDIVDIQTKLQSFLVKQVLQLIRGTRCNWKYFAVYWIGLHLRKFVPSFADLTIPHSENIPTHYKVALRLFKQFVHKEPGFMTAQRITTKFIYNTLIEARTVKPRIINKHPLIQFSITWKWIHCPFVDAVYRDLSWRIAHDILPTQHILYKFKSSRLCKCNLCQSRVETLTHLFFQCPMVVGLWTYVAHLYWQLTGLHISITQEHVLFNVFTPWVSSYHNDMFVLLVNLMKFCIWTKRNLCKFELHKVTKLSIKFLFMNLISLRIKADFARLDFSEFSNYWGTDNAIVYVKGKYIKLLLRQHPP